VLLVEDEPRTPFPARGAARLRLVEVVTASAELAATSPT
jgi:hypothetical protein